MNKWHTLAIAQLIPHRPPMLLLDRIIEADFEHVIVETVIREGSTFYQSGCGVPALVGIEYMAQAAATLGGLQASALTSIFTAPIAIAAGGIAVALFALGPAMFNAKVRNLGDHLAPIST